MKVDIKTWIAPWRKIKNLEADNEKLLNLISNPELIHAEIKNGRLDASMQGPGPRLLAEMFVGLLDKEKPENYLEISFQSSRGKIVVTVQQPGGKTPHELRKEAESRVKKLESMMVGL